MWHQSWTIFYIYIIKVHGNIITYLKYFFVNSPSYLGYQKIECLEEYTELKCLWLECNALTEISGLENQSKLRSLFVQNNFIRVINTWAHTISML